MITIIDYAKRLNKEGKEFFVLLLQGGLDFVRSQQTGKYYATMRKCSISSTFDEATCKSLIGQQLPGSVQKMEVEPYEYTIRDTGEVVTLRHQWVYLKEGETLEEKVFEGKVLQPAL